MRIREDDWDGKEGREEEKKNRRGGKRIGNDWKRRIGRRGLGGTGMIDGKGREEEYWKRRRRRREE